MILEQKFTLAQIGGILDKNPATLRTHINRGYVVACGPRNANGNKAAGKHSRFSFFTLMEFALAYRLADMGVQLETAFKYAAQFAHAGGGGNTFRLPDRLPGLPFHQKHGQTMFAAGNGRTFEEIYELNSGRDLYTNLRHHLGNADDFILVNVSKVFNLLCARIGSHPYEALDEAYPEDAS